MAKVLVSESKACGVLLAALSLVTASFIPEPMIQYFPWIFVKTQLVRVCTYFVRVLGS